MLSGSVRVEFSLGEPSFFWRDHLLSGVVRATDGYDDALCVILFPRGNVHCVAAVAAYKALLTNTHSFTFWHLEDVVRQLLTNDSIGWAQQFLDRYCDFAKIERALGSAG